MRFMCRNGRHIRLLPESLRTVSAGATGAAFVGTAHGQAGRGFAGTWAMPRGMQAAALHAGTQAGLGRELRAGSAPVSMETAWQAIQADDAARLGVGLGSIRITHDHALGSVDDHSLSTCGGWDSGFCAGSPSPVGIKRKSCDLAGQHRCAAGELSPVSARFGHQQPLSPDPAGCGTAFSPLSPQRRAVQQLDDAMQVRLPDHAIARCPFVWKHSLCQPTSRRSSADQRDSCVHLRYVSLLWRRCLWFGF